jgi:uncharacterized phage-associated protein
MSEDDPPYDARRVANHFLERARSSGRVLSLVSLMKLIYFAHGLHLARYGGSLVREEFEAWDYGPVVRTVWEALASQAANGTIRADAFATRFDPLTARRIGMAPIQADGPLELLDFVLDAMGDRPTFRLVELTHEAGSPWHQVWNSTGVNLGMKISNDEIRQWFIEKPLRH